MKIFKKKKKLQLRTLTEREKIAYKMPSENKPQTQDTKYIKTLPTREKLNQTCKNCKYEKQQEKVKQQDYETKQSFIFKQECMG